MTDKVVDFSKALEERKFKEKESRLDAMRAAFAAARKEAEAKKITAKPTRLSKKKRRKKRGKKS
ncbi:MAG: hypothetical protein R3332_07825 [Pseudohongiellaceae bacterium]|nr:hypothetical protein [Pseudohongiellaceae bacterium]